MDSQELEFIVYVCYVYKKVCNVTQISVSCMLKMRLKKIAF